MCKSWLGVIIISLCLLNHKASSRCLGEAADLKYFIQTKNVYLVKVLEIKTEGSIKVFKVRSLKTFKGKILEDFLVFTYNSEINWQEDAEAYLSKDSVYLIEPHIDKEGKYRLSGCSYILSNNDKRFKRDSICFSAFNSSNVYVNNDYYRGAIVNGKLDGKWVEEGDSGTYTHGTRVGKWIEDGKPVIYKNGTRHIYDEYFYGDTIIKYHGHLRRMVYRDKTLRIWKWRSNFNNRVKLYNGDTLVQCALFGKYGGIKRIKCYEHGKLIYSKRFKRDGSDVPRVGLPDVASDFFYFSTFNPRDISGEGN
jgi:hypothetical protein